MSDEQSLFPELVAHFAAERDRAKAAERVERVRSHRESMRSCWPEWNGNARIKVGTRVECHSVTNELACDATAKRLKGTLYPRKKGEQLYTYMAPCRVVRVVDSETFIAEIQYSARSIKGAPHVERYNGLKLRLDILDVWPPCSLLIARRDKPKAKRK